MLGVHRLDAPVAVHQRVRCELDRLLARESARPRLAPPRLDEAPRSGSPAYPRSSAASLRLCHRSWPCRAEQITEQRIVLRGAAVVNLADRTSHHVDGTRDVRWRNPSVSPISLHLPDLPLAS